MGTDDKPDGDTLWVWQALVPTDGKWSTISCHVLGAAGAALGLAVAEPYLVLMHRNKAIINGVFREIAVNHGRMGGYDIRLVEFKLAQVHEVIKARPRGRG